MTSPIPKELDFRFILKKVVDMDNEIIFFKMNQARCMVASSGP